MWRVVVLELHALEPHVAVKAVIDYAMEVEGAGHRYLAIRKLIR